jgi:hypothetical protein
MMDKSDRLSVRATWFPEVRHYAQQLYVYRFYQDVHNQIIPSHRRSAPSLIITPESSDNIKKVCVLLANVGHTRRYPSYLLRDLVSDLEEFISTVAGDLVLRGVSTWEIVTAASTEKPEEAQQPSQELVKISGITRLVNGEYHQMLGDNEQSLHGKEYIAIPKAKVWEIEIPLSLGGRKVQERLIKNLAELSDSLPQFFADDLSKGTFNKEFEIKHYSRRRETEVAKLTSGWGWTIGYGEDWTRYYYLHRQLKYRASLARLRITILERLNELFQRLGWDIEVSTMGQKSPEEIEKYLGQLATHELSFEDAQKLIYSV